MCSNEFSAFVENVSEDSKISDYYENTEVLEQSQRKQKNSISHLLSWNLKINQFSCSQLILIARIFRNFNASTTDNECWPWMIVGYQCLIWKWDQKILMLGYFSFFFLAITCSCNHSVIWLGHALNWRNKTMKKERETQKTELKFYFQASDLDFFTDKRSLIFHTQ